MDIKYNCLNPISNVGLKGFDEKYTVTEDINDADVVLVRSAKMHDMGLGDKVKAIARAGAGVNNIPLDKCADNGIVVFNTPGANANGVKELVIAGLLLASRDIVGGVNWVLENKDEETLAKMTEKKKKAFAGTEILGKKLGVVGLGAIGILVANAAVNLGMEVYGYDPYLSVDAALKLSREIHIVKDVNDLYKESDFVTIHVPALDSTKGMINKDALDAMKDGVVILNFARDILVNSVDIKVALENGKVKKYVTDFPVPDVAGLNGTIVIPHLGASTAESEDNCAVMAVKEIKDFIENGNIANSVNFPACDMGIKLDGDRITILHKNIPNMIGQFTAVVGAAGHNISNMANKSRGQYAYTIIDVEDTIDIGTVKALEAVDGVLRVRIIK